MDACLGIFGSASESCVGLKNMTMKSMFYLGAGLALNTLMPLLMRATQSEERVYNYNITMVFVWAEVLKLVAAGGWCFANYGGVDPSDGVAYATKMTFTWNENLHYFIPGFLFFAQNNLSFVCVQYYQPASYQLLMNTRIVLVAVLSTVLLRKRLNQLEWCAVFLISIGAIQHNLPKEAGFAFRVPFTGLLVMLITATAAALGNVYTQLVVQAKKDQPIMWQNLQLYAYGVVFNGINWLLSVRFMGQQYFFGEVTGLVVFEIVMFAVYGLTISVILKEFGAIVRTIVGAISIVCNGALDVFVFGSVIDVLDGTSYGVIMIAVHLFTNVAALLPKPQDVPGYQKV